MRSNRVRRELEHHEELLQIRLEYLYELEKKKAEHGNEISVKYIIELNTVSKEIEKINSRIDELKSLLKTLDIENNIQEKTNRDLGKLKYFLYIAPLFIIPVIIYLSNYLLKNEEKLPMNSNITDLSIITSTIENKINNDDSIYNYSGDLVHRDLNRVPIHCARVNKKNFIAEVLFTNPYDGDKFPWSYGILFRRIGANDDYRITLNSSGRLGFGLKKEDSAKLIYEETGDFIDIDKDAVNYVKITVKDEQLVVYINDNFIKTLTIKDKQDSGDICVATGILGNDTLINEKTKITNFKIYELP